MFSVIGCSRLRHWRTRKGGPPIEYSNTVGIVLVQIPAGTFWMGATEPAEELVKAFPGYGKSPDYFSDEYPRHRVQITKPFYLGKYEITVGQFRKFTQDSGYRTEAESDGNGGWGFNSESGRCEGRRKWFNWQYPGFHQADASPVVDVTWNDAVAFCRWLSRKEGTKYRLPTEAEWEYADRAGGTTRFPEGDDPATLVSMAHVIDMKRHPDFGHVQDLEFSPSETNVFPQTVGRLRPNHFGLYDTQGNVWEWVSDWYGQHYYSSSPTADPQGPISGGLHVRRGGGWNSFPIWARASFRNWNTPESRCVNLGFRIVREL